MNYPGVPNGPGAAGTAAATAASTKATTTPPSNYDAAGTHTSVPQSQPQQPQQYKHRVDDRNSPRKFFIANLDYIWTSEQVKEWFVQTFGQGSVEYVKIVYHKETGKSKGFGFLHMSSDEATAAVNAFANEHENKITLLGRHSVHLRKHEEGLSKKNSIDPSMGMGGSDYNVGYGGGNGSDVPQQQPYAMNPNVNANVPSQQYITTTYPNTPNGGYVQSTPAQQTYAAGNATQYSAHPQPYYNTGVQAPVAVVVSQPPHNAGIPHKLLLTNVPLSAKTPDLVSYLSSVSNSIPSRCVIEYDTKSNCNIAHLEFNTHVAANNLVSMSQNGRLIFEGFQLGCTSLSSSGDSGFVSASDGNVTAPPIMHNPNSGPGPNPGGPIMMRAPSVTGRGVGGTPVGNGGNRSGAAIGVPRPGPSNPHHSFQGRGMGMGGRGRGGSGRGFPPGRGGRGRGYYRGGYGDGRGRGRGGNQNRYQPY